VEVVIRPVVHGRYEATKTDAVSRTYEIDGFTLMNAVLSQPKTLNEAVAWAMGALSPEQKSELCELSELELPLAHRGLGGGFAKN